MPRWGSPLLHGQERDEQPALIQAEAKLGGSTHKRQALGKGHKEKTTYVAMVSVQAQGPYKETRRQTSRQSG